MSTFGRIALTAWLLFDLAVLVTLNFLPSTSCVEDLISFEGGEPDQEELAFIEELCESEF